MNEVYTKKQIIDELAKRTQFSKKDCEFLFKTSLDIMKEALIHQHNIDLTLFGKFEIIETKQRNGYNPKTNEKIMIEPSKKLKFKPSKILLNEIKNMEP